VGAAVVPATGELDVAALAAWAAERLSPAKRPRRWLVTASLPLNPNGKVDRLAVRREMLGG
jgi:acyl-CoA synthetase (AMP-forming)/AMP-acid ligase II